MLGYIILGDTVTFRAGLMSELGNVWPVLKSYHAESMLRYVTL